MNHERMKKELEAQRARVEALRYLDKRGCGAGVKSRSEKNCDTASSFRIDLEGDNTTYALALRRSKERKMKKKILNHQEEFRKEKEIVFSYPINSEWSTATDPCSGETYYWNKYTKETSWENPLETAYAKNIACQSNIYNGDWTDIYDASSGCTYYYNRLTGETTWVKPLSFLAAETASVIETGLLSKRSHSSRMNTLKRRTHNSAMIENEKKSPKKIKKHSKAKEVDPLDPTGGRGGWADRLLTQGEYAADTTVSGPLYQQRPYPAPGSVIRKKYLQKKHK